MILLHKISLRTILFVLFCFLTPWAKAQLTPQPISLQWGAQEWVSQTHLKATLHIKIKDGHKFYGPTRDTIQLPPELTWKDSKNISQVSPHWPATEEVINEGQKSHVYHKEVLLPLDIHVVSRASAHLKLELKGMACEKLCIPFTEKISLNLTPPASTPFYWMNMLFFAFLGGLLLNIMPCVLPVLGLKLRGLTAQSPVGLLGTMTTAGILFGFWILAGIIIVFKVFFGRTIGWGMQLQSPLFSSLFALLMIGASYSLFGIFHLRPPQWIYVMSGKNRSSKAVQFFFSGFLAVLLATPCSAPFLGPALGFALTGSPLEIWLFYTCIGLGFAFPYLLILVLPVTNFLPKPGPWMLWFEKAMGTLFLLSAGWFIGWPFASFLSHDLQKFALGLWVLLCLPPLLIFLKLVRPSSSKGKIVCLVIPFLSSLGLLALPFLKQEKAVISMQDGQIQWVTYEQKAYDQFLNEGKIIYIDVTALGCALCMINKKVYVTPEMQKLFVQPDVVCMRADYSHGDPKILQMMQRYRRAAIPFNLLISRHHSQGIVLEEVLTVKDLMRSLTFMRSKMPQSLKQQLS